MELSYCVCRRRNVASSAKVSFEAQILISNLGKATFRLQQSVSVQLFGKPTAIYHLVIQTNLQSSNLAACWDWGRVLGSVKEGQIIALDRVQKKAVKFAHHTNSSNWETLASLRKLSRICALFKAYSGEMAWTVIGDKLQRLHYLSRVDHERKFRSRRQRTDIGEYSFVNTTIQDWNQLPAEVLGTLPCKLKTLKTG
jgi:hypothetical protein